MGEKGKLRSHERGQNKDTGQLKSNKSVTGLHLFIVRDTQGFSDTQADFLVRNLRDTRCPWKEDHHVWSHGVGMALLQAAPFTWARDNGTFLMPCGSSA